MAAINNRNNKLVIAGSTALLAEPLLVGLMHGGGVGAVCGLIAGGAAYILLDDHEKKVSEASGKGEIVTLPSANVDTSKLSNFGYRLLNGKSARGEHPHNEPRTDALPEDVPFDLDGIDDLSRYHTVGDYFLMSDVLTSFKPTHEQIFLARTEDNQNLICKPRDLCHVALAGATGGGKSSIMRALMLQLCKAKLQVLLLNPHYTDYDLETDGPDGKPSPEDWTPFKPYLMDDPIKCMDYGVIDHYLKDAAKHIIPKRLERRAKGVPIGKPYFVVLDELPAIVKNVKNAPDYLGDILREGRKVGVFLISASQDFLVKTIAPDGSGGAVRDCYRTAYYVGGDATTAKILLDMPANKIAEDEMGKGVAMLRSAACKKAIKVFIPYVDNEALYRHLGPSTYKKPMVSTGVDLQRHEDVKPIATDGATHLLPETITVTPERFPGWFQNGQPIVSPYYEQTAQLSFSSGPQMARQSYAQSEGMKISEIEKMKTVKQPVEPYETLVKITERDESFIPSREDETSILMAVIDLQTAGQKITREAIKQKLGWNNAKHPAIKAVCDKHHIAER